MSLLEGKNALIFGVANKNSIAWGITLAFKEHGANLGISYVGEVMKKRVVPLAESINCDFVEPCDVSDDAQIEAIAKKAKAKFGKIDIIVHAIAFAGRELLDGPYYKTTRDGFSTAMDISVFSFTALANAFQPIMNVGGSLITLTYYGSEKVVGKYNVMGVAKAALESSVRYLANDFGKMGIRVNAISPGAVRTLAASGVSGFRKWYSTFADVAPLRSNILPEDVGNSAVFLASDLSSKITGEVLYVDSGYKILGLFSPEE